MPIDYDGWKLDNPFDLKANLDRRLRQILGEDFPDDPDTPDIDDDVDDDDSTIDL